MLVVRRVLVGALAVACLLVAPELGYMRARKNRHKMALHQLAIRVHLLAVQVRRVVAIFVAARRG